MVPFIRKHDMKNVKEKAGKVKIIFKYSNR